MLTKGFLVSGFGNVHSHLMSLGILLKMFSAPSDKGTRLWKYHTLSDKLLNWKFKKSVRYNRIYDKYLDVSWRFDVIVQRGLQRIAMAD